MKHHAHVLVWGLLLGCGGSAGPEEAPEPPKTSPYMLTVRLAERPADFPSDHVRAALAWVDGRPLNEGETTGPGDLRELKFAVNSDVPVSVSFPLELQIPVELVQPTRYQWHELPVADVGDPGSSQLVPGSELSSLPQAEVVLYFDGDRDRALDLLAPGEPGPGPDRVLALSSGRDARGNALRSVLVNKRGPFEPPLELFVQDGSSLGALAAPGGSALGADGVYVVQVGVKSGLPLAQEALLETHGITSSSTFDRYWARMLLARDAGYAATPLAAAEPVQLFPAPRAQRSWLARGCQPYPTGRLGYHRPPPAGAAIECGADVLAYASHPEDYCGQTDLLERASWQGDPDLSWWPCDARGLKPSTPYVVAREPLGLSALSLQHGLPYTGRPYREPPPDFSCRPEILYDFDDRPELHLPALAPPAGSQVRCYGHDALSFVPQDASCKRKFTYDLSSDALPGYAGTPWDLRGSEPSWWPCSARGELKPGTPYVAPEPLPEVAECPPAPALAALGGEHPPPPHSKIRCVSASSLIAVPLWADACDGRSVIALAGTDPDSGSSWKQDAPAGWPCDADGQLVQTPGYEPMSP